ncbi:hypothetical protein ACQP1G_20395 [Nocardia sp. CA-107356]|uniref:hypothetical protein n=1 Tax=Nocardia sp. CA-107356 TaxID=3239972 RepID=UPI003D913C4E
MTTMTRTTQRLETATGADTHRSRKPTPRAVVAPPPRQRAPVWDRPVLLRRTAISDGRPPLMWLLGAHGGAGTSSLERALAPAADCARRWPAPIGAESPYVVVVARETAVGLAAADALLRQHHAGLAGDSIVVGLVTVAARPGRMPSQIRRDRDLYSGLVEHMWHVGWHEAWMLTTHTDLPVWTPGDAPNTKTRGDELAAAPRDVHNLGQDLVAVITALHNTHSTTIGEPL